MHGLGRVVRRSLAKIYVDICKNINKAARTDANLQKIVDDHNVQSREFLDYTRVIKYGACNISDPNATKNSQNQPKNTQKPSDITYLLLTDSFVFFTKTHHENKVIMKHPSYVMEHPSYRNLFLF